jgi:hypothetical protein
LPYQRQATPEALKYALSGACCGNTREDFLSSQAIFSHDAAYRAIPEGRPPEQKEKPG